MKRITAFLAALFLAAGVLSARESLKVASIFSDHMVLQRETQAPVWGWAQPGAKVTVSPSWDEKSKYTAKVEKDGSLQLSMFQLDDPLLESLRDRLKAADLNNMTPMQAFDLLRAMKEELGL